MNAMAVNPVALNPGARAERVMFALSDAPDVFCASFQGWLSENMAVYEEFEARALRLWEMGRKHYSARTIMESIRHDSDIRESSGQYKINNNIVPDCARLFLLVHPEKRMFDFRCARSRKAVRKIRENS